MANVLVLQGPNLNLLGSREPGLYGSVTLDDIVSMLDEHAAQLNEDNDELELSLEHFQSNSEAELIERIHNAANDGIVFALFNPAAFTHTSVALRDALLGAALPFIEIHISNVHAREPFRRHSYFSDIASGVISGLGAQGYILALDAAYHWLGRRQGENQDESDSQ
ncbi:type II 3-dehydroquinate dehydratase [Allohahella marinimesophila]|uniref:3-dehydroquinate dehydratase n=1 Tax=Allohahella marinimesophila TaxID=1054972 RepID=A0ABP7PJ88_9GAMM